MDFIEKFKSDDIQKLVAPFIGKAFQDANKVKNAILKSPASKKMKETFISMLEEIFGPLDAGKNLDCLITGWVAGALLNDRCYTQEQVADFWKLKEYISDTRNLPYSQIAPELKTASCDGHIALQVGDEVHITKNYTQEMANERLKKRAEMN